MAENQVRLVNLNYFSINFPSSIESEILREHVISTIEKLLESGKNTIILTGEEGIGKTTLLKQFAQKNYNSSISSFLNPFKEIYSSSELLLNDLFYQIFWLLNGKELDEYPQIDLEKYRDIFFTLKRDRKRRKDKLVFLIDGLEHINDEKNLNSILSILPIGEPGFSVLLSGKEEVLKKLLTRIPGTIFSSCPVPSFSIEETKKYFEDIAIDVNDIDFRQIWLAANKGVPGRLQAIKRAIIDKKIPIDKFLDEFEKLDDIHQLDLEYLNRINDKLAFEIVKFVSLDDGVYTIEKLANVTTNNIEQIKSTVGGLRFLSVNNKDEIIFNSIGLKKYFSKELSPYKSEVIKKNINYYIDRKNEAESLIQLPRYYTQDKDYESLIQLLSEDYFPKVIKSSQSISTVQNLITAGFNAAKKTENDLNILNFSLHGSLIENIEGLHIWDSELEARIELGDYDKAISLANSALVKEERLRLLAKIGKVKRRKGDIVEDTLLEQIKQLYSLVDFVSLGIRAIDIAADLFYSMPDLALNLIKSTSEKEETNINDWVLAKLTINAVDAKDNIDPQNITSLINDPKIKEISNSLTYLFGKYNANDILKEAKKLSDPQDRIMFLRIWIRDNQDENDITAVLPFLITQLVERSSKEFTRVSILRDITSSLCLLSDFETVDRMIKTLLTFKEEAKKLGSNLEYFQFIINIFKAKVRYNYNEAFGLFYELSEMVNNIPDLVTKVECLATLSKCLNELIIPLNKAHKYLPSSLKSNVKNLVNSICEKTAYHFDNLKDTIEVVASYDPEFAIEASQKANTIYRRDNLLIRCWVGYISNHAKHIDLNTINKIYTSIESSELKNLAIRIFIQNNIERKDSLPSQIISFVKKEIITISAFNEKSYCLVQFISFLSRFPNNESIIEDCKNILNETWKKIDTDILKIEIGFLIAGDLAKVDHEYATKYLKLSDEIKREIWPDSINTTQIYANYIEFLIRIYVGLIKTKQNSEIHYEKIKELINNIPSPVIKIELWSYFGFFCNHKREHNLREKIVSQEIRPILDNIIDRSLKENLFVNTSPLLYFNSAIETVEQIKQLSNPRKEEALSTVIDSILTDSFRGEPFESTETQKRPTYEQLFEVTKLLSFLHEDANVYSKIEDLIKIASDTKVYSNIQRDNLKQEIIGIIEAKLPNPKFIKHPGFKLIAKAQLIRLERDPKLQEQLFTRAIEDVEKQVNNESDKTFIYLILAELLPSTKVKSLTPQNLVNKSLENIEGVSCDIEFIYRIEFLSKSIHKLNPSLWKRKLEEAFKRTINNYYRNSILSMQKRLLDNAHKHDPIFAKSLMATIDSDESRTEYRKKQFLKEHYETLEIKQKIANEGITVDKKLNAKQVAYACRKSLASLNSGTITTKKTNHLRELLDYAIKLPIVDAHPIYSYYLQNLLKRQEDSPDLYSSANSIFNSIYSICKVIEVLSLKHKSLGFGINKTDYSNASSLLVKVGDREKASKFIKDWMQENEESSYFKIIDPYFSLDDLEIVKVILEISKDIEVQILTSGQVASNNHQDVQSKYSQKWRSLCEQQPPFTRVTVATIQGNHGKSPFHDRGILAEKSGLRLGTSFNSLGESKDSEISQMDIIEKVRIETEVFESYFNCKVKEIDKHKKTIKYAYFNLL